MRARRLRAQTGGIPRKAQLLPPSATPKTSGSSSAFSRRRAIPLDPNGSERELRRVALGRRNYLFVHNSDAGESLAGLSSLVAACEARAINEYLIDILARVQDHASQCVDEWLSPDGSVSTFGARDAESGFDIVA